MNLHRYFLILTIIIINISDGGYIHPMEKEEYEGIKKFVTGDFKVPVFERLSRWWVRWCKQERSSKSHQQWWKFQAVQCSFHK